MTWFIAALPGVLNWQHRLWITIRDFINHRNNADILKQNDLSKEMKDLDMKIWNSRNYFNATATYHFQYTQKLSVGISRLQSLTNVLRVSMIFLIVVYNYNHYFCTKMCIFQNNVPPEVIANSKEYELALASLIIMLTPVTPHFCSELWAGFLMAPNRLNNNSAIVDWQKSVLDQKWPQVDDHFELSFLCKVCKNLIYYWIINLYCDIVAISSSRTNCKCFFTSVMSLKFVVKIIQVRLWLTNHL